MMLELTIKYLHFAFLFLIVGSLFVEAILIKPNLKRKVIKQLAKVDAIYGIGAIGILAAGFSLWFWVGKPADFYTKNWVFHLKIAVFALVGILSIVPTVFFMKNRKGNSEDTITVPLTVRILIKIELFLLFVIPVLAVMMARGVFLS